MSGSLKNNPFGLLVAAGLLFFSSPVASQRIGSFHLYPTHASVVIKFTVSAGPSCAGFTVFHSTDSLNFTEIGSDPAICGISTEPEEKSFTHSSPVFNQVNYYRVRLEPYVEISASKSVFVPQGGGTELLAYPNPVSAVSGKFKLKIPGAENERLSGEIHDRFGKMFGTLELVTQGEIAEVPVGGLAAGLYFIRVSDGTKRYCCKLMILR